jgi:predicted acetyltransferase
VSVKIRQVAPRETEEYYRAIEFPFSDVWDPEELELEKPLMDPQRMVTAEEDGVLVGGGASYTLNMTIPGGSAGTAGVTWIGVMPTHRRRGILTGMMAYLHEDAHRRGEPLAALWAAESAIYPRFGYGLAAPDQELQIDRGRATWADPRRLNGRARLIAAEAAPAQFGAVYETERAKRPGMVERNDAWWRQRLFDSKERRNGAGPLFHIVYEGATGVEGYVAYRVKHDWAPGGRTLLTVLELMATSEDAYRGIWSYCFGVDLVDRIRARHRPIDEPLPWMLADFRRLEAQTSDALWLRLVEVDAALSARTYAAEGSVVFEVADAGCPWNTGRHRLEAGPDGAACAPSDAEPDIRLDVRDLGAAYLGGVEFGLLLSAGRVEECRAGAVARADAMFRWRPYPWCASVF